MTPRVAIYARVSTTNQVKMRAFKHASYGNSRRHAAGRLPV
jgi:hypothetical protein